MHSFYNLWNCRAVLVERSFWKSFVFLCLLKAVSNRLGCLGPSIQVWNWSRDGVCRSSLSNLFLCLTHGKLLFQHSCAELTSLWVANSEACSSAMLGKKGFESLIKKLDWWTFKSVLSHLHHANAGLLSCCLWCDMLTVLTTSLSVLFPLGLVIITVQISLSVLEYFGLQSVCPLSKSWVTVSEGHTATCGGTGAWSTPVLLAGRAPGVGGSWWTGCRSSNCGCQYTLWGLEWLWT